MSEAVAVKQNGTAPSSQYHARAVQPPVDVFENADQLLVVADVPGVPSASIDVKVDKGVLTIEARRPREAPAEHGAAGGKALAREYEDVDFLRSFELPPGIDAAAITAEAKNGTVVVVLPKIAAAKSRKIVVRTGG